MRDFTLLTLLRPSEQSIGQWLTRVLPFVNSGAIKNITVTSSIRSEYLVGLSKLCNLNIISCNNPQYFDEVIREKYEYREGDLWELSR